MKVDPIAIFPIAFVVALLYLLTMGIVDFFSLPADWTIPMWLGFVGAIATVLLWLGCLRFMRWYRVDRMVRSRFARDRSHGLLWVALTAIDEDASRVRFDTKRLVEAIQLQTLYDCDLTPTVIVRHVYRKDLSVRRESDEENQMDSPSFWLVALQSPKLRERHVRRKANAALRRLNLEGLRRYTVRASAS